MNKKKLIIIDGNALIHRAFHALPPLTTKDGQLVNAVYGFTLILLKIFKELKPHYLALTLDKAKKTFRHQEYADYKATRQKQPDELYDQIPLVKDLARSFNIPIYEKDGYEADDLIGTICRKTEGKAKSIIVTGDLDTLQLVDEDTEVYTLKRGITDTVTYDQKAVKERYGLKPEQMIDFKALRGDPSDNIPGVKGIGEKTALELLKKFETLEEVLAAAKSGEAKSGEAKSGSAGKDKKIKERYQELLVKYEKDARLSKKLVTIVTTAPITFKLEDTEVAGYDRQKVFTLFQQLGFKSLLARLPEVEGKKSKGSQGDLFSANRQPPTANRQIKLPQGYHLVNNDKDFKKLISNLKKQKLIVIDTETTSLNTIEAQLLGIGFCWEKGEGYYLSWNMEHETWNKEVKKILGDKSIKKIGHNLKYDIEILKQAGIELNSIYFDTMIASYLLNPGTRAHDLDTLAFTELGHQMISIEDLIGKKGKDQLTLDQVPVEKIAEYCCEDVDYTYQLYKKLEPEVKKMNFWGLMEKIEMPLIDVLSQMELTGVKIDTKFLERLDAKIEKQRVAVDKKIYKLAGKNFNIASPIQLKEILFDKLKISTEGIKKIKTGISTAAPELEKLRGRHKIIDYISEHRELAKLQSTYTQALPKLVNQKTGRVHTSFNQTVTATGRLSSSDPNLQNIPIRTELGREIRKAFIAEKGYKILTADYSQVELRIVASLAKDKRMLEIFQKGKDIHQATAAEIHGVSLGEVTKDMRYKAKEVNFGVLYGMGVYGLAWRTGITRDEAKYFIDKYFKAFSGVKKFVEQTVALAKKDGQVETLFGRVRYLPDINSGVVQIRNAAERMAINAPIQGTAADLMKLAMIEVQKEIKKKFKNNEVRMILQVHDELVFEVKEGLVKKVGKLVKEIMEQVYKLRVPIEVEVEVGENWGETRSI